MKNKAIRGLLLAALLAVILPAADAQQAGEEVFAQIRRRGELRVGMLAAPRFPYTFWNGGQPAGLEADLAADIAGRLGVRLAVDSSFASRLDLRLALEAGRIDIAVSKYKRGLDDALRVRFSVPYSRLNYVLLVNRVAFTTHQAEGTPEEVLRGKNGTIGTIDDARYRQCLADHFPLARVTACASTEVLYRELLSRTFKAAFVDEAEARELLADRPELGLYLQYVELPDISDSVCLATGWRNAFLADWLDILIESRGEPSTLEELFQAYHRGAPNGKN